MRLLAVGLVVVCASFQPVRAEILIGVSAAMSGTYSHYGEITLNGVEAAVDALNANGGLLGEEVDIVVADDFCSGEQATAAAEKLASSEVAVVVGHPCSGGAIPASKVYDREELVMIATTASNPRLTDEGGDYIFRIYGRDDHQGVMAGEMLAERWPDGHIAILHDGQAYGQGLAKHVEMKLVDLGLAPEIVDQIEPGQADYSSVISRFEEAEIDVLYYGGYAVEAGLIIRQMRDVGSDIQLIGGDGIGYAEFWNIADQAGESVLLTLPPNLRKDPAAVSFLVDAMGLEEAGPGDRALFALAAVQAWAKAVEIAGTTEPASVADSLREAEFDTALGQIGFDDNGDITGFETFSWYVWKAGNIDSFSTE
ncbi:MAG: branched-chain amino acid ABC transporter substrate-binding protein [Geminicoccaceae bacterium]